jgi:hypothetical protein
MFDRKVRLLTEGLARTIGRRKFLTQVSTAVFAGVATLAAGRTLGNTVSAQQEGGEGAVGQQPPAHPFATCQAPGIGFCSVTVPQSSDGCQGAYCFQHKHNGQILECRLSYNYGYAVGCWTVMDSGGAAYWTCCDCECGTSTNPSIVACGCARYSALPMPVSN